MNKKILLFDGSCNICNGTIQFLLPRTSDIFFASINSPIGQEIIKKHELENIDSIIFYNNGLISIKSDAILNILIQMNRTGFLFSIFKIIPIRLRNYFYDIFAQNRYKWFGEKKTCRIATLDERKRFLS